MNLCCPEQWRKRVKSLFFNLTLCLTISSLFVLFPKEISAAEAEEVGAAENEEVIVPGNLPSLESVEKGSTGLDDSLVFKPPSESDKPSILIPPKKDFSFDARAMTGMMYYKFEESFAVEGETVTSWQDNIPFLGVGFRLGYKTFSLDAYFQQSASGKDSLFDVQTRPLPTGDTFETTKDYNTNLSRKDYAINLSYSKTLNLLTSSDGIGLSIGYKVGKTDISGTRRVRRGIIGSGESTYEPDTDELQYETKGPSVGIGYSFKVGKSSLLGINLAYAKLKPTYNSKQMEGAQLDDTSGVTIGLRWNGNLTKHLKYGISIDRYQYSMTGSQTRIARGEFTQVDFNVEESVLSAKVSLSYTFF